MSNILRGSLGFKGEKGDSAYDVAVRNGFIGTEKDWLATIGTQVGVEENKFLYTSTTSNQREIDLPSTYTSNSIMEVYVENEKLRSDEYSINTSTKKIVLVSPLSVIGTKVEVVLLEAKTGTLPIVETISDSSTNDTAPSTLAVYNLVENTRSTLQTNINTKFNSANIKVLTGNTSSIPSGGEITYDVAYPSGFNKSNTLIIGKMCSYNNVYYDTENAEETLNGFPVITMVALTDDIIRLWIKNASSEEAKIGYYKLTLMKI